MQGRDAPAVKGALAKIEKALRAHPVFCSAARPRAITKLLVSRYESGMTYGRHVDDALMGGRRSDLSFTLFLSEPESYEGGELVIERSEGERGVKLPAGQLVLYPSRTLHRVEPVRAGVRLAAVGWIESQVRSGEQREILFDLDRSIELLRGAGAEGGAAQEEALDLLLKTRSNLLRDWIEA